MFLDYLATPGFESRLKGSDEAARENSVNGHGSNRLEMHPIVSILTCSTGILLCRPPPAMDHGMAGVRIGHEAGLTPKVRHRRPTFDI